MESIVYFKFCSKVQLGHLYEHLFSSQLARALRKRKIFVSLDYTMDARTYYDGFLYIEIRCLKPLTATIKKTMLELALDTDEDLVLAAIAQIVAEKQRRTYGDWDQTVSALTLLDGEPWISLGELEVKELGAKKGLMPFIVSKKFAQTRNLQITFRLSDQFKQHAQLLPLFYALIHILAENNIEPLYTNFGYFHKDDSSKKNTIKYIFRADKSYTDQITTELGVLRKTLKNDIKDGILEQFIKLYSDTSYTTQRGRFDELQILEATGAIVGAKGWKQLATKENLDLILKNTTLQLKYRNKEQQLNLGTL